ncbi:MAG: pilus assembly protein [Candidatus Methanomethylicus sp.]|nr:pilus assembly protein [Candidatus Methanomethylicus sp.]
MINHKGQSLVETAIFLLLILWLLAGAVDFGMGFFSFVAIRDAAQEGALYGTICQNSGKIITRVQTSSTRPVNLATTTITVSAPSGTSQGQPLTVTVIYNYPVSTPLISTFVGSGTIPIRASATSTIIKSTTTCP